VRLLFGRVPAFCHKDLLRTCFVLKAYFYAEHEPHAEGAFLC
jgi:hypothetical protein